MTLRVAVVTDDSIFCGDWLFDRETGMEVDPALGWGPADGITGTIIREREK
jgi:hypothetical protein